MRIAWVSNTPWATTGYGQQTAQVVSRLAADGHEPAVVAVHGLHGSVSQWNGIPVFPCGLVDYSNDVSPSHAARWLGGDWQAEYPDGWVITLFDVYCLKNPRFQRMNVASWTPVDHLPAPPDVVRWFTDNNAVPIAMSRFGEQQLQRVGLDTLYVPHGIDTEVFSPGDKRRARDLLALPQDAFIVTMNAANQGRMDRKSFWQSFAAFGGFAARHSDAVLFVHSEMHGFNGLPLTEFAMACGIPTDRIVFIDQYAYRLGLRPEAMAEMYRASDVLLAPSRGEGFGIPVVEAQACGTPVIVSNFSAQPELVGDGWLVDGDLEFDVSQHSAWLRPSIGSIADALEQAYRDGGDAAKCRAKALEYDADRVFAEFWRPTLEALEARAPVLDAIEVPSL